MSAHKALTSTSFQKLTPWFNFLLSTMIYFQKKYFFSSYSLLVFLLNSRILTMSDISKMPTNLKPVCISTWLSSLKRPQMKYKKIVHQCLLLNHLTTLENSATVCSRRHKSLLSPACINCYSDINFVEWPSGLFQINF